jgi:SAM-dependent methyltransferase
MTTNNWRQRVKPLAEKVGITSSADLYRGIALRQYRKKIRDDAAYRKWTETEAPHWAAAHWGHEIVNDEFVLAHLTSQLYELTEMLRRRLGEANGARLLDAGASDGMFLARLGALQGVGVNFLQACARKIRSDGYAACLSDIEALPFADKTFDYVICCETVEHVLNPIGTINELARVCRKRIIMTIPWLARTRINARPKGWPDVEGHVFEFSERDFMKVISFTRTRVVYQDRVQVFPEPSNPLVQLWLTWLMYPSFFPKLQYYELEPV